MINITPKVEKGSVVLTCDGSKYELPGTEKTRYCNGKSESLSAEESFEDLLSSVPSFNIKADVDKDGNVTLKTPMSVEVTGTGSVTCFTLSTAMTERCLPRSPKS